VTESEQPPMWHMVSRDEPVRVYERDRLVAIFRRSADAVRAVDAVNITPTDLPLLDEVEIAQQVADAIQLASHARIANGWVPFGFHANYSPMPTLEFDGEDVDGYPVWERCVGWFPAIQPTDGRPR
jgi:hypothetical protein